MGVRTSAIHTIYTIGDFDMEWDELPPQDQDEYLTKARYLIDNGYRENIEVEDLAILIFKKGRK